MLEAVEIRNNSPSSKSLFMFIYLYLEFALILIFTGTRIISVSGTSGEFDGSRAVLII